MKEDADFRDETRLRTINVARHELVAPRGGQHLHMLPHLTDTARRALMVGTKGKLVMEPLPVVNMIRLQPDPTCSTLVQHYDHMDWIFLQNNSLPHTHTHIHTLSRSLSFALPLILSRNPIPVLQCLRGRCPGCP